MVKEILKVSFFAALVLCLALVLRDYLGFQGIHPRIELIVFFFYFMSIGITTAIAFLQHNLDVESHFLLLAGVASRLILALFGFLLIHQIGVDNFILFGLNFSVLYLLFLVFEITSVLSNLRRNSRFDRSND